MATKKKSATSRPAKSRADERAELARLIYTVMNHPALPADLRTDFYSALNEFENTIDLTKLCYSEAALTHAFELRDEEGSAR